MHLLLISTYEMGHQPVRLASPAAALRAAGHEVTCRDLSVQEWDAAAVEEADAVAFSVPMHTAMRLALRAARQVRVLRPDVPVCFYGLYAPVSRDATVGRLADHVFAGEYEPALVAWADGAEDQPVVRLGRGRGRFHTPARELLPSLERYARLAIGGEERLAGSVETTHGCKHACRHCPVPTVYGGAFRVVPEDVVAADIDQLVAAGARHISFADPDFLNGPTHALRVVRALHARHPDVTFDCTVKVEHILDQAHVWPEMAAAGCLFVVCAVELCNDWLLGLLDKGHTAAQAGEAVHLLRRHGIELRPSFLPFTPWTQVDDVVDILDFVIAHDLVGNVDPVQYTIRLLLPEGSLLLDRPELAPHLGPYDAERLTHTWTPADPSIDALQTELTAIAEAGARAGEPPGATFLKVHAAVRRAAGDLVPVGSRGTIPAGSRGTIPAGSTEGRPRLTEPWFC
ncbi:MAG TPA: CUAEP/CCAEP-tail radical SAM protein [Egibacteraceae bacterium]|nr:CUAEP/CCAEP-tail radical SAM protein [Egibacteraceae bacterium]